MRKGLLELGRRLGRAEKLFAVSLLLYLLLKALGMFPTVLAIASATAVICAGISLYKFGKVVMAKAMWRLRNRLIAAYVFIAVVPIVLIVTLAALACYVFVGQVAVYFVRTELANIEGRLLRETETLARTGTGGGRGGDPGRGGGGGGSDLGRFRGAPRTPGAGAPKAPSGRGQGGAQTNTPPPVPTQADIESMITRLVPLIQSRFPNSEILLGGREVRKFPADSALAPPPPEWGRANGLIRDDKNPNKLYIWAHVMGAGTDIREVTMRWPVTSEMLSQLEPRLSNVSISDLVPEARDAKTPPKANALDVMVSSFFPLQISSWSSPNDHSEAMLVVNARISAVLGIIFEQKAGQKLQLSDLARAFFLAVVGLFVFVEAASLWAGVKITRTMTGAVHELYEGTRRIKEADFSYRIPVKGNDQLAELSASFNVMTANLGRLIVVAQEKERLQSELEIAREVQNQLFPRDTPSAKTLRLYGMCKPARMVSGDYYDFMTLSGSELAFAIGDVAGKGISAALLMATIQSTMRTQLNTANLSPHLSAAGLVSQLNRQLYANTAPEKYATFYFALYDEANSTLTYTNAGHLPPLLVRDGVVTDMQPTGTVVGAFPFAKYEQRIVILEPGDILVGYTDGIVEPENSYGEMFGENRLKDLILRNTRADSQEIIAKTMEAVTQWTGSSELQDDMTMVLARRV